ncbi:proline-rich receptor-like protein kinase PERK9 [Iris pallida]|uniref:Proline-rich receptor-like protein kinase PERK9 n=1 Tax=Iris pallida TaxID=29817 RepID=A0AAX6GRK2_IRIPA|nr:proline-rich receptor-like protein kinase PERK9 [Iris pallida]KAJ6828744.1 proline-rich receptor-like protein kinase PERK9 [Iris pallida]KAJ6828745.1 proline-rich receptor-like protein kinase PERK9 [Iris pallida]KAJ6831376.1 proline-rich receptor-like protein kinase PERK9 [Iris pallida]KAJ6835501.1 proline-rich receptor-like protein kinase PERK9 [Iris pallida]
MPLKRQYQCHQNTANSKKLGAKVSVSNITIIVSTSGPTPGIRVRFLHPVPYNRHTNPLCPAPGHRNTRKQNT